MTPPGDRNDDREDDREDDPQLRSLRAVWVSMREEAPSDRGLAALMAAARDQAGTMKPRTPWWQRALAGLRRPPVLALATVVVVLGGALVISQRRDTMTAQPTVTARSTAAAPGASAPSPMASGSEVQPAATPEPTPALGSADHEASPAATLPATPPPAEPVSEPQVTVHRKRAPPRATTTRLVVDDAAPNREAPPDETVAIEPRPRDPRGGAGFASPIVTQDAATRVAPPSVEQLVKQCEVAAARGDCRAVRDLAAQISRSNPGTYKARIAKNASLSRCLE